MYIVSLLLMSLQNCPASYTPSINSLPNYPSTSLSLPPSPSLTTLLPFSPPPSFPTLLSHSPHSSPPPSPLSPFSLPAVCNFIAHEKCLPNLRVSCRHVITEKIMVYTYIQAIATCYIIYTSAIAYRCIYIYLYRALNGKLSRAFMHAMPFRRV